tara:strand:+ start:502 stop:687 length:186 start_codon:yes stop_codon:yes gene_type:complete
MEILIQFDDAGMYQNNPWDVPVPYRKGEIHSVDSLLAIVLIDQNHAHLFVDDDKRMSLREK